jgi:hypothetical protein
MEPKETPDPAYLKGFNEGYTIAKHMPDLSGKLAQAVKGEDERSQGFLAGQQLFSREQLKEQVPSWMRGDYSNFSKSSPDTSKEPDITPER